MEKDFFIIADKHIFVKTFLKKQKRLCTIAEPFLKEGGFYRL